jgi:hypothetical protein
MGTCCIAGRCRWHWLAISCHPVPVTYVHYVHSTPPSRTHFTTTPRNCLTCLSTPPASPTPSHREAERAERSVAKDSLYWTAAYMDAASRRATAQDPQWGLSSGMSPMAALCAARWRMQARRRRAAGEGEEEEEEGGEAREPEAVGGWPAAGGGVLLQLWWLGMCVVWVL